MTRLCPNDSGRSLPRSQDLRRSVVSFRLCFPRTATKASAQHRHPLARFRWETAGCCGGVDDRLPRSRRPRTVGGRVHLDAWKMWQTKGERAASIAQGKRYAERWSAARLYHELRLRAAVVRLLASTASEPLEPLPGLPPTREQQQQALRLAEAGAKEIERIKEALEPRKPRAETKPRPRDARKAWVRAGLQEISRGV